MKRLVTGILLVLIVLGALYLRGIDPLFFAGFIAIITILSVYEMAKGFGAALNAPIKVLCALAAVLLWPSYLAFGLNGMFLLYVLLFAAALTAMVINKDIGINSVASFAFILIYPTALLSVLLLINDRPDGLLLLLLSFSIGPVSDTFAYLVGSTLKGPKLCPHVSPKKTVSGAIGGLIGGIIAGLFVYLACTYVVDIGSAVPSIFVMLAIGFFGAIFTILGDLAESAVKRRLNVKDFSNILPGHGGVLDRMDSIMFNALFIYLIFTLIHF